MCRELGSDGNLVEGTFKDGMYHGLLRGTSGDQVVVSLHRDGQILAWVIFNQNFEEIGRHDKSNYLVHICPQMFR